MSLEIERKFLIACPDLARLRLRCTAVYDIEQTYLTAEENITARVRRRVGEQEEFFYTEKEFLTARTCVEREKLISSREYEKLLARKDLGTETIRKRRFCLPSGGLTFEIDVYPFWEKTAVMEVELAAEDQALSLPEGITVLREVTEDRRMKNAELARHVPTEEELLS